MGGASSFLAMLSIAGFLAAAWLATKFSRYWGVSSIVLEIATGVLLGPSVFGLVAKEYAECQHLRHIDCSPPMNLKELLLKEQPLEDGLGMVVDMDVCHQSDYHHDSDSHHSAQEGGEEEHGSHSIQGEAHSSNDEHAGHEGSHRRLSGGGSYGSYGECLEKSCQGEISRRCQLSPDFFTLIGHTGVAMMIFESGMHFDFDKLHIVGPGACVVAVCGTIMPFITGAALTWVFGRPLMPDGVAVGTALAPTSVGIALRLLGEAKVLQEDFGQSIITAAFVDDILSLILFNVLFSLTGEFHIMPVVVFPIIGIAFMAAAMYAAVKFWPWFINDTLLSRLEEDQEGKASKRDEALFLIMMILLVAYATITHFLGTHLWGCFMAGMSFACLGTGHKAHHAHNVWVKQTKRATSWMIRIFFAATVAFSIPVSKLLSLEAFLKGSLMGIGPCILTKVFCAPFAGSAKWVIGWAMVGRAEFAYLIAQMAAAANMMDSDTFSLVIWALLYATVFAPFIFRKVLDKYVAENPTVLMAVEHKVSEDKLKKDSGIAVDEIILDHLDRN